MLIAWSGRGWWVTWITALAMFLPMIVLRQVDGPEIDRGVAIAMTIAAITTIVLGLRFNRGGTFDTSARAHSLWGIPMQLWAVPMALFAILLGTGTITTAEEPSPTLPLESIVQQR
ncbi:hypothetical protein [Mangrovicella endophytica]|uniref:hypothetical protein n=1 Tax=Mangrovicella endophytica TaxID=2066697 RepID=UPI000C9EA1D7|nr:hypothetical protein [Mangrovicella endophytica]